MILFSCFFLHCLTIFFTVLEVPLLLFLLPPLTDVLPDPGMRDDAVLGIKIEIERLVISILMHSIRTTFSRSPVSFSYVMGLVSCRMQL